MNSFSQQRRLGPAPAPAVGAVASASRVAPSSAAFTLLEVMIAMAIFCIAIFAILEMVSTNLRNARRLQQDHVDAGMIIADLYQTNKLVEGTADGDFGGVYPNYRWASSTTLVSTNGFFQVDYVIIHPDGTTESNLSTLLWRPESLGPPGRP